MKYIDKFANIDAFLNSELRNITGDRVAVIDGFNLPILKKKPKKVIDPSTNEEVEELQDVWAVPVGQVEKKVDHDYSFKSAYSDDDTYYTFPLTFTKNYYNFDIDSADGGIFAGIFRYLESYPFILLDNSLKQWGWTVTYDNSSFSTTVSQSDYSIVPYQESIEKYLSSWEDGGYYYFIRKYTNGFYAVPNKILHELLDKKTSQSLTQDTVEIHDSVCTIHNGNSNIPISLNYVYNLYYSQYPQGFDINNLEFEVSFGYGLGTAWAHDYVSSFEYNSLNRELVIYVNNYYTTPGSGNNLMYLEIIPKKVGGYRTILNTQYDHYSSYTPTDISNEHTISSNGGMSDSSALSNCTLEYDIVFNKSNYSYSRVTDNTNTTEVLVPKSAFDIHVRMVVGNGGLEELVLPEGTTTIDSMALQEYSNGEKERPTKFAIPEGVTTIKDGAFWGWRIEEISFPSTLELVEGRAFQLYPSEQGGTRLTSVTLPSNCKYFDNTFGGISQASFAVMESDPNTMQTTWYPVTVNGGQVYSKALSEILTTEQKQTLMNNSNLYSGIWNQLDPSYYENIQKKVTIADFDNIYPQASDDPMNQPYLSIDGNYMFSGWQQLKEVRFPSYATGRIGNSMFENCTALQSVTGIDNITEIGSGAFRNTAFQSFTLPASVSTIKQNAFRWESNDEAPLTSFIIPSNSMLTKIEGYAFAGQINLMEITLPDSCKYMANSFPMLTLITGGVQAWDMHDPNHYGQIVEDGTTEITYGQFQNNQSDFQYGVSYYMPSTVTTISDYAFQNTGNLQRITLHEGITSIGLHAFDNCNALGGGGDSTNIVALPSTLSNLGEGAFRNCNQASFSFPASWSVTSIPENCFNGCSFTNATSISIPSGVTSIGNKAFMDCYNLSSATIPSTVTSIGEGAFAGTKLTNVTLPNGCTWYETSFPAGCTVNSDTTPTPVVADINDMVTIGRLTLPTGLDSNWFQTNYGYDFICTKVIFPEGVTSLNTTGGCWFPYNCQSLIKEVQMPTTLTSTGIGAFSNMPNLETLDISHLQYINERLCENDTNLFKNTAPTFDANVSSIGSSAFKGTMKNVTTLDLSGYQYLNNIGGKAFEDTGLTSVTLPTNCTYYLSSFPEGCTVTGGVLFTYTEAEVLRDTEVKIWPDGATSVTQDPLTNQYSTKTSVTSLTVPADIQTIGMNVFNGYSNLTSLTFQHGEGNTLEIQTSAFENDDIRSLSIPIGCTTIGQRAFANNPNLSTLTFTSSKGEHDLTTIGQGAFADTALTAVTFPAVSNATYWPNSFPAGCTVTGGTIGEYPFYINSMNSSMSYSWQSNWTKIYFQSDVTSTMSNQFEHSENIIEVEFDNSNSLTLQPNMFKDCPYLATATFKGAAVVVSAGAFSGTALTSVTLPEGSTYEPGAFPAGCTVTVATAE